MGAERSEENRRFVPPPGYTQLPNVLVDEVMPAVTTLAELKVTLAIGRETFGWQRGERRIGLDRIMELTGLSRTSAQKGIAQALERGYLGRRREGHGFVYGIRIATANIVGSLPSSEESTSYTQLSTDSGLPSNKGNKTLRGKENSKGADAPSAANKPGTIKGKPGQRFKPDPDDPVHDVIVAVFTAWVEKTKRTDDPTLTVKRATQIRARLREQAEGLDREVALSTARDRLLKGIEGWASSDWHRERDAFGFDTFFRSRGKVDMFRERAAAGEKKPKGGGGDFSGYGGVVERG